MVWCIGVLGAVVYVRWRGQIGRSGEFLKCGEI